MLGDTHRNVGHDNVDDVRARAGENAVRTQQIKHPEEAIDEAGLDQKPKDSLHAFRRSTPSELLPHVSTVFPVSVEEGICHAGGQKHKR